MQPREHRDGRFITLEGPDGAGKSTQAQLLAARLREGGHTVLITREPGGTPLGERLRAILLQGSAVAQGPMADALLFNAARSQLVTDVITPALDGGKVVICDRYADSTLAYQGFGAGLDVGRLRDLGQWATSGLRPGLTILFDVPVEVGLARRQRGPADAQTRFEQAGRHGADFHRRVRDGYCALSRAEPARWRLVNADRPAEQVALEVGEIVDRFLSASEPLVPTVRIQG
ncbi:MAG: dTMP kinase [Chloroflexi bacterium]|nr:dTMP kinase [Chloroflexota bacterium]